MTPDQACPTCPRPDELEHAEAMIAELRAEATAREAVVLNLRASLAAMIDDRDLWQHAYVGVRDIMRERQDSAKAAG